MMKRANRVVRKADREGLANLGFSDEAIENKKQAFAMAKRDVQNQALIEAGLCKAEIRNYRREIVEDFFVNSSPATVKYA
jgi:hypothetical protein